MWLMLPVAGLLLAATGTGDPPAALGSDRPGPQSRIVPVEGGRAYTDVNAAGLATLLQKKTFPLINVHIPYEGEIKGTDLHIRFDAVEADLGKLPGDKSTRIVLYCRSGAMSAIAAETLVRRGYTNVWNLHGGMIEWVEAGYPLLHSAA